MQKGWTPADFETIKDRYLWNYYMTAYELAIERENEILNEYVRAGVLTYGR